MSFMQTYYTSCEVGLRGCKGFQFNAAAEGIDESIFQQIERLGLYVPPVNAPSRPSPSEIRQFPISLVYQHLRQEGAVLAQAIYMGPDYSGRFGNYFTHALVSTAPELDIKRCGFLPIEMWRSEVWVTEESPTTSLAPLDNPQTGEIINLESVDEFLKRDGNMDRLPAFLTAVEGALSTGQRIIIVADSDAIALWIAAVSYALPVHLVMQLTFNTYVKNPYQTECLIVGTTPDSDFNFAPHEIEHQYYVFDFMGQHFSPLSDISAFALNVTAVYRETAAEGTAAFASFVERVSPDLPLDELNIAFGCYAMMSGLKVPEADAASVVKWCASRLERFSQEQIYLVLSAVMSDGAAKPQVIDACTDLFLATQSEATPTAIRTLVEIPYLEWLITDVGESAPLEILMPTIERLVLRPLIEQEMSPLRSCWVKQLRQTEEPARLCALLQLGNKLGFLDETEVSLRALGEKVLGPALGEPFVQMTVTQFLHTPAMQDIIYGIGASLVAQIDNLEAFRRVSVCLDQQLFFEVLENYAVDKQDLEFYYRLLGVRAERHKDQPDARLKAFRRCLTEAPRFGSNLTPEDVNYAFEAVWLDRLLTLEDALQVLSLLQERRITDTNIPRQLVGLLVFTDANRIDQKQWTLASKLSETSLYDTLDERRALVDAYIVINNLRHNNDNIAAALSEALQFIETYSSHLSREMWDGLNAVAAARLTHVKDIDTHSALLARAYCAGGMLMIDSYGKEIEASLAKRAAGKSRAVARLFQIGLASEKLRGGAELKDILLQRILPGALRTWGAKEMETVDHDRDLLKDSYAHQLWVSWREEFLQHRGPLKRFKRWLRSN